MVVRANAMRMPAVPRRSSSSMAQSVMSRSVIFEPRRFTKPSRQSVMCTEESDAS